MLRRFHTVLLVEDQFMTNVYNEKLVSDLCIADNVCILESGKSAIDYVSDCIKRRLLPEIILLDIFMPGMDGWECLDFLGKMNYEKGKFPAVIILSTSQNPKDKERALSYPFVIDYIHKPLTAAALVTAIGKQPGKNIASF